MRLSLAVGLGVTSVVAVIGAQDPPVTPLPSDLAVLQLGDSPARARPGTRLLTTVRDVATHYVNQISAAAWKVETQWFEANTAATLFSGASSAGDPAVGILILAAVPGTRDVLATMRVVRTRTATTGPLPETGASLRAVVPSPSGRAKAVAKGRPSAVPEELTNALLIDAVARGTEDSYEVRTTAPTGFPTDVLPAGAVVGVVAISKSMTTVVATAPKLVTAGVPALALQLLDAGWLPTTLPPRGFWGTGQIHFEACRAAVMADVRVIPRSSGGSLVRVALSNASGARCVTRANWPFVDVPVLSAVIDHYTAEMAAGGWQLKGEIGDSRRLGLRRFSSTSRTGDPISSILIVTALPGTATLETWLQVTRDRPTSTRRGQ